MPPRNTPTPEHDTARMERNALDQALARGVAWTGAVKWFAQILSWGSTLLVARILAPADFGLVGMATIYLGLATVVAEAGLGSAVIHLRWLDDDQIAQLNTVSVLVGVLAFGVSLLVAEPIAAFFEEPGLTAVIMVMSGIYLINGLKPIPLGLLEKNLRYKWLGVVDASKAIIGSSTTLIMAWLGFGYWSLVGGFVSGQATSTLTAILLSRHRFAFPRRRSIGGALRFSTDVVGSRMSWFIYSKSDFLIAGKMLGTIPLGLYSLAWTLAQAPMDKVVAIITRVTPGVFARVQSEPAELRRYLALVGGAIPTVLVPLAWGAALVAPTFVPLLLGDQWTGMIVPFQILCLYMSFRSLSPLFSQLLVTVGDTRFNLRISIVSLGVLPPAFYVGSFWGPMGIATAWLCVHPFIQFWAVRRALGHAQMSFAQLLKALAPGPVSGVVMAAAVLGSSLVWRPDGDVLRLLWQIAIGATVYIASLGLLFPRHLRRLIDAGRMLRG